jgi:hypothetical protein
MRYITLIALVAFVAGPVFAEDEEAEDNVVEVEAPQDSQGKVVESDDLKETGAERNARKDEELAVAATYYNEEVDSELDKVVCKKEQVVGSRRKVRVCKTVREIEEEKEASKRLMMRRNRSGTGPADVEGSSN